MVKKDPVKNLFELILIDFNDVRSNVVVDFYNSINTYLQENKINVDREISITTVNLDDIYLVSFVRGTREDYRFMMKLDGSGFMLYK